MSSLELSWRSARRLGAAGLIALATSGCLRPLYGPTATGEPMKEALAAIEVAPVLSTQPNKERAGHYLRSELIFELDGSGEPSPKRYRLTTNYSDWLTAPLVDVVTGRASTAIYVANAGFALTTPEGKLLATGVATVSASYDRTAQRFATVRAARDAEIRAAKELARQIRTRLAIALASPSDPPPAAAVLPNAPTAPGLGGTTGQPNQLLPGL